MDDDYRDDPRWIALQEILVYEPPVSRIGLDITLRTMAVVLMQVIDSEYATWTTMRAAVA